MGFIEMFQASRCFGIIFPISILMIANDDDREFICQLYNQYRKLMYAISYEYFGSDNTEIDDAIGITVERLCRYCSTLRKIPENRQKNYIVSMTGNVCRDLLRKRNQRNKMIDFSYTDEMFVNIPDQHDPIETVFDKASAHELIEAFAQLPSRDRELIRMYHIDKTKINIIAKELNISEGAIRTALSRARKNLLKLLNDRKEQ